MGGNLICDILEADLEKTHINTLVIEANVNEPLVRSWLTSHGWQIVDEDIVEDAKHYYEIIVAQKGEQELSSKELYFGKYLLENKSSVFIKKWQWQKRVHEKILRGITREHEKYPIVKQEYHWILEVLNEN